MGRQLLLLGGGGHCRSVIDSLISLKIYEKIGIVDSVNSTFLGVTTVGTDDDLETLFDSGWTEVFITVGSIGNTAVRKKLYKLIKKIGFTIPTIIDPTAAVAQGIVLKEGVYIGKKAVVNSGAEIGECSIINTGSIIEHDCSIGAFSHISPGAVLCGEVKVGSDSHIGAGSVVRQKIVVGDSVLVGAGSVLLSDLPDKTLAYGNPCKVVE